MIASYSGAEFEIRGNNLIKRARNLHESGMMQAGYASNGLLYTPTVYNIGQDFIEMQYINPCKTLAQHIDDCYNEDEIYTAIAPVLDFVVYNNLERVVTFDTDILIKKISHTRTRLHTYEDIKLANTLEWVADKALNIELPVGAYHGDLTFNNVIIDRDIKHYIIDFLPCYYNSPIMDVIKLKQEYKLQWSRYFFELGNNYDIACDCIKRHTNKYFSQNTLLLEAVNYLRILPYTKNDAISTKLRSEIKEILHWL